MAKAADKSNQQGVAAGEIGAAEMEPDDSAPPFAGSDDHFYASFRHFGSCDQ